MQTKLTQKGGGLSVVFRNDTPGRTRRKNRHLCPEFFCAVCVRFDQPSAPAFAPPPLLMVVFTTPLRPLRQLYKTNQPARKPPRTQQISRQEPARPPGDRGSTWTRPPLPRKHRFFGDGARRPVFSASKNTGISCGNRCRFARKTGRVVVNQNSPWWAGKFRGMLRPPGFAVGQMGPVPADVSANSDTSAVDQCGTSYSPIQLPVYFTEF